MSFIDSRPARRGARETTVCLAVVVGLTFLLTNISCDGLNNFASDLGNFWKREGLDGAVHPDQPLNRLQILPPRSR